MEEVLKPDYKFKTVIYGCEARGDAQSAYLTRYTFLQTDIIKICLHIFHRSDADDLHDHPWDFLTFVLWRGYKDHTSRGVQRLRPFMGAFRKAEHAHRVELIDGKRAITFVVMFKRRRNWGFFTSKGWTLWTDYFRKSGC